MIVIVDANIILSGIINPHGAIPEIILLQIPGIEFIIPDYTIEEINLHRNKICRHANISIDYFQQLMDLLLSGILVFSSDILDNVLIKKANELVSDIDEKDAFYVAFSLALDALIWTGDLKLYKGLKRKGFEKIVTTFELQQIIKGYSL